MVHGFRDAVSRHAMSLRDLEASMYGVLEADQSIRLMTWLSKNRERLQR